MHKPRDGRDGRDGVDGVHGKDGQIGQRGPKGDKGDKGDTGRDGKDAVIAEVPWQATFSRDDMGRTMELHLQSSDPTRSPWLIVPVWSDTYMTGATITPLSGVR